MLFRAVSNWLASAASRSRATSACMNILCRLAENCVRPQEIRRSAARHARCNRVCRATPARSQSDRSKQQPAAGISTAVHRPCPHLAARIAGGDGQTNHMGDGVVAAQQSGGAPYADRSGVDHRPDLIALLPPRSFIGGQRRFARLVPLQVERPDGAEPQREARHTPRSDVVPSSARSSAAAMAHEDDTRKQRSGSFEQRIDQRRANGRRYLLIGIFSLIGKLHFGRTRPFQASSFTCR